MTRLWRRALVALLSLAVLVGALWLLFFPITELFAARDVAGMTATDRFAAISTLRGQIGAVVGAGFVAAGLYYTGRKYFLDRDKQYTDRFNDAVEHLGSDQEVLRAGGIRALERILHDSPTDRQRVLRTITGFLRGQPSSENQSDRDDINAALDALRDRGNPPRQAGTDHLDLRGVELAGTDLSGMHWASAILANANLRNTDLSRSDLREADLTGATLINTDLTGADLTAADLRRARLAGGRLDHSELAGADLRGVDLSATRGLVPEELAAAKTDASTRLPDTP